jgi:hypothetical protein
MARILLFNLKAILNYKIEIMKKSFYFLLILPLILFSCKKEKAPYADFSVESGSFVVGQELYFQNNSSDAVSYEWDFGDGYVSEDVNPIHAFNSNGTYEVILTAKGHDGTESSSSMVIEIKIPTLLMVDVIEWNDDPNADYVFIPNTEIRLYESWGDWETAEENWILMAVTDRYGSAVFANLDADPYYVDAYQGYNIPNGHDNYTLAYEDVNFVMTPEIIPNYINYFVAWVDPADHTGTKGTGKSSMVIKKLERMPPEIARKRIESLDWKELYERSVKK